MNKIIYAGTDDSPKKEKTNKYFEFIIPERGGGGGRIVASDKKTDGEEQRIFFDNGEIAVIPPYTKYRAEIYGKNDLHILVEQAMLPLKEPFTMTDVENEGIRRAAEQAVIYFNSHYEKKDVVLAALGNLLVGYVTLRLGEDKKYSPVVKIVLADVENNLSDTTYSLEDSLKKLPLNYDYVRKLFKKETGATPHEYLTARRMERAKMLLTGGISNRYSNYSVSQVAEACGFAEPLYFSRVFKKYYGVSPSDFLKNNK